jgi:hypothetical protein
MSGAGNIETGTNVVQFVGGQVAKAVGGVPGHAAASLILGEAGLAEYQVLSIS